MQTHHRNTAEIVIQQFKTAHGPSWMADKIARDWLFLRQTLYDIQTPKYLARTCQDTSLPRGLSEAAKRRHSCPGIKIFRYQSAIWIRVLFCDVLPNVCYALAVLIWAKQMGLACLPVP